MLITKSDHQRGGLVRQGGLIERGGLIELFSIESQLTKPSFKLTSAVFPESHCVILFMVVTFHLTKFLHEMSM